MTFHEAMGVLFLAADDMIVRWQRRHGGQDFEPETYAWMWSMLAGREGVFVDVGASTGWFTIPVARIRRRVYAIECNPRSVERLRINAGANHFESEALDVAIVQGAASDARGVARFRFNPTLPLTSGGTIEAAAAPANTAEEEVETWPLDEIVAERVALIKIDVEGHELAVLRGAAGIIARDRPPLILEANTDEEREALLSWCAANGYTATRADTRNLLCRPAS